MRQMLARPERAITLWFPFEAQQLKPVKISPKLAISATALISMAAAGLYYMVNNSCEAVPHAPESVEATSPAPTDQSVKTSSEAENARLDKAIEPYVAKARAGLPAVKKRFAAGMPKDEMLMLTIRVYDPDRKFEQVFVSVQSWTDKEVVGNIASEVMGIKSKKMGDDVTFDPKEILDWTIVKSDGTEEGNVVGNFLNTYK